MNQLTKYLFTIILFICFIGCSPEKEPLPELTYFGDSTRIQNPLSPEDSQKHIQLPKGFEAVLFASEPDIINPIAFAWDERGRLWVVQSMDYPHGLANDVGGDRITICEDTNGDGKADKFIDFATEQSLSTGIVIVKGGALVSQAPEMVFLEDTDGDDKMDKRSVIFDGFGTFDTHAGPSSLRYGLDNAIWGAVGYSGYEKRFNDDLVSLARGVYRFGKNGEFFEPIGLFNNNTWGLGITQDFQIFGSTANNNHACFVGIPLKHYNYLKSKPSWAINADPIQGHYDISPVDTIPLQQVDVRGGYTAAAGANFYTADNYPTAYQNQMYVNEPTGHLVHLAKIVEDGAGFKEVDGGNIFASTDSWTAPVFTETGPDGNLWVADWYNPVIQHNPDKRGMDNQIWNADKGKGNAHLNEHRDKANGRIYIIKHKSNKKSKIKSLNDKDLNGLIGGLKSNNMFWRTTAQRLIVENQILELVPQLEELSQSNSTGLNAPALHALWTLDGLNTLATKENTVHDLVQKAISNKSDAVKRNALALLPESEEGSNSLVNSKLLNSKNLHVRLAAILRASELPETKELNKAIEELSKSKENLEDKWLNAALKTYFKEQNTENVSIEEYQPVIQSADENSSIWKYTTENPSNDWYEIDFDDGKWLEGPSSFGSKDGHPTVKTVWDTEHIWMRKHVKMKGGLSTPVLKVLHREGFEVFVNGKLIFEEKGRSDKYKFIGLDQELASYFRAGLNTIAIHCYSDRKKRFIDIGFGKLKEFKAEKTISINTVPQKMAYDKTVIHAMAGQNLEIILTNKDEMQHNMVIIQPESIDAFGKLVDEFLQSPDAAAMEYVPNSRYVIGATKMIDPQGNGSIQFRVPDKPGDYPFICTFPGHWRIMQGVLKVSARGSYVSDDPNAHNIVVMGGGGSHDFLKYFGIASGKILSQGGKNNVSYTENSIEFENLLTESDLIFISNNKPFNETTQKAIFSKINAGTPMMIYHPSTWYNWTDWPEYNQKLVGGGSKSHEKLQEFEVEILKPNHPIMKGVPSTFRITDELYRWEKDPKGANIEVLAIGKGLETGAEFPVVWVVKNAKAKIVCNTLGHDQDAHDLAAYKTILNNTYKWIK